MLTVPKLDGIELVVVILEGAPLFALDSSLLLRIDFGVLICYIEERNELSLRGVLLLLLVG